MIPSQLEPLADHLWQSTLFAALAGLLTLALRNNRAQTRYWLWLAASVKFLVPFSVLVDLGSHFRWRTSAAIIPHSNLSSVMEQVSQPFAVAVPAATMSAAQPSTASLIPAILGIVWAIGFVTLVCSWWLRFRGIRAALHAASPLHLPVNIEARSSPAFSEPGVFGILRPVLLMPAGITGQLTAPQLEAILTHELCHVRRRDNLAGVIHMAVEAVFWFHPLVWWLGARLMEERERACDEEVLRMGSDPEVYAEGILKICELYFESPLPCVAGVTGANLKKRIEAIMSNRIVGRLNFAKKLALTVAGTAALAVPIAIGVMNARPIQAQSQAPRVAPAVVPGPVNPSVAPQTAAPRLIAQQTIAQQTAAQQRSAQPAAAPTPAPTGGVAVILVLDKSSSMEGRKLELARLAASSVVDNLRPIDTVGVLIFDNILAWAVPPGHPDDRAMINRQLAGITADRGTQIAPALTEAYTRVLPISATYKHIVLLTDGISEEGNSMDLARAANGSKVTISTVGLGPDVNRAYLEKIAQLAGGKSYFLTDPQGLDQIMLRDVQEHTGSTSLEKPR